MDSLTKAKSVLLHGGVVIFPTETVYGVGCLLNFPSTIKKLYQIKKRDFSKPTLILVKNEEESYRFVHFNPLAKKLADHFWPGPLTICLPAKKNVPKGVLGPKNTLGVRVPSLPWLQDLLQTVGHPLLAPSANFQGDKAPAKFAEIDKRLTQLVDYVVDIEPGNQQPSTVVLFDPAERCKIIRQGAISSHDINQVLSTD